MSFGTPGKTGARPEARVSFRRPGARAFPPTNFTPPVAPAVLFRKDRTMTKTGISLADLNAKKASEVPIEFEYIDPNTSAPSGVFLSVIGTHSDAVTKAMVDVVDAERKRELIRAAKNAKARPDSMDVESFAEDIDKGAKQAAKRLVGWRTPKDTDGLTEEQLERFQGIVEPWSPENALLLCRTNPDLASQVMAQANNLGNWLKVSPPKS